MILFLSVLSVAASLAYGLVLVHEAQSPLRTGVKTLPVLCLTGIGLWLGAPALLVAGLTLGTLGDAALSREGHRAFLIGLGAFLLGHLCYLALFWGMEDAGPSPLRTAASAAVIGIGAWLFWHLYDSFGALRWPVWAYVAVSVTLGIVALWTSAGLAVIGVVLFILSDVLLAFDLFGPKRGNRMLGSVLWFTYWAGQGLILMGIAT